MHSLAEPTAAPDRTPAGVTAINDAADAVEPTAAAALKVAAAAAFVASIAAACAFSLPYTLNSLCRPHVQKRPLLLPLLVMLSL